MRRYLVPIVLAAASGLPAAAVAQSPLTFSCRQTSEIVVTVRDDGTTTSVQPKMDQPLPIRVVVQPNFTESGQTKGTASILDDRGRRKERFEGSIELGKSVDANNGAWHLDLESRMLRIVQPVAGRSARFMIYRCGANGETPKPRRFVFRCEDSQRVVATFRDGNPPTVMVEFGKDERRVLPIGRTGSGARYADKGYIFWNKGNSAIWTTPERETTCVTNQ